jgi:hypothetical protein
MCDVVIPKVFCDKKPIGNWLPDKYGANCPPNAIGALLQNTKGVWCDDLSHGTFFLFLDFMLHVL